MTLTGMGRDAVYAALSVLEKERLLTSEQPIDKKSKKFGRRVFKVSTRYIQIFVAASDVEPLPEFPYTGEPYTGEPYTENRETYQLNNKEQINELEQINEGEQAATETKISHLEAEKKKENFLGAPAPPPPAEPTPRQINLTDRPNAKTPTELKEALSRFYAQWQNEWAFGVLENSRGRRYSKERQGEIVLAFCCHAIKSNRGGDTYQMLNADLQSWFLRQPEFEKNAQSTTLAPAPQPKQIIRIGQE
ncbi:MAG: hypothetical protein OHK0019_00790 [Saprospiraceae bacterium]